jgi:hypothetical protein
LAIFEKWEKNKEGNLENQKKQAEEMLFYVHTGNSVEISLKETF